MTRWTDADYASLRAMHEAAWSQEEMVKATGRTPGSINHALRSPRLHGAPVNRQRTEARAVILRDLYPKQVPVWDIIKALNDLPGPSIKNTNTLAQWARLLGLRRPENMIKSNKWTPERDDLLRAMIAKSAPDAAILDAENRLPGQQIVGPKSVWKRCQIIGIKRPARAKVKRTPKEAVWPEDDIRFLRDNLGKMEYASMARALNRTLGAVKAKVAQLDLNMPQGALNRLLRAKPEGEAEAKMPRQVIVKAAPPPPAKLECRYRGLRDIAMWFYRESGAEEKGKPFDPAPDLQQVNALARRKGKPYFFAILPAGNFRLRSAA